MKRLVFSSKQEMGRAAARAAAETLHSAIQRDGNASFIVATGASQFEMLEALASEESVDWAKTTMFHLDEYVGLGESHPASFRKYLHERLVDRVHPGCVHFIQAEQPDPMAECRRLGEIISEHSIDVALVGIGENGHLAFNDPPADFETSEPFLVVELDEACRRQQVGEGWFATLDDVPRQAISMSIHQIMKSKSILCIVPDERKAHAVRDCLEGEITAEHPASILQRHHETTVFLDQHSASLLRNP